MSRKSKEFINMSEEDLNSKLKELDKSLIKLNAQVATGTNPQSPMEIRNTKRTKATILGILNQKKIVKNKGGLSKK
ncbi:50S ribosomal protein L29 [Nanoarchaeota archaeon]